MQKRFWQKVVSGMTGFGLSMRAHESVGGDISVGEEIPEDLRRKFEFSGLFDAEWYRETYKLSGNDEDPFDHYVNQGWKIGFWPSPKFDGPRYLSDNPDVFVSGMEPLRHFIEHGAAEGRLSIVGAGFIDLRSKLESSGLFDAEWYRETYGLSRGTQDPLDHYLATGWKRGFWPSPKFDGQGYLIANPDVAEAGMEPLQHFIDHGGKEGRTSVGGAISFDLRRKLEASGLFDARWYCETYGLTREIQDPLGHYVTTGWRRGFWPGPTFNGPSYLAAYPDVADNGMEPLQHFIEHGAAEGRQVLFDDHFLEMEAMLPSDARSIIGDANPDMGGAESLSAVLEDPVSAFIARAADGREILEVGFRGTASLELISANIAQGAKTSRVLADSRPFGATERLERVSDRLGVGVKMRQYLKQYPANAIVEPWQPIWTDTVGLDWYIHSHFYERDLKNKIGYVDLLVTLSSIFVAFEVLHFLERASYLTDDLLIFDTPIIEPFERLIDGTLVRFDGNTIWSASSMNNVEVRAMDAYWKDRGISLGQFEKYSGSLTRKQVADGKLTGVWWWFFGLDGLRNLLEMAGFELLEYANVWEGRSIIAVASKLSGKRQSAKEKSTIPVS
jgi:hypothetical protein